MHGAQHCQLRDGTQGLQKALDWGMAQWGQHCARWELDGVVPSGLALVESEGWHLHPVSAGTVPTHPGFVVGAEQLGCAVGISRVG